MVKPFKLLKTRAGGNYRLVFEPGLLSTCLGRDAEAFSVAFAKLKLDLAALGRAVFLDPENQDAFDLAVASGPNGTWVSRFIGLDAQMHKMKTFFIDGFMKSGSLDNFEDSFEVVARFFSMLDRERVISSIALHAST